MNRLVRLLLATAAPWAAAATPVSGAGWTLETAVAHALASSPDAAIAAARLRAAEAAAGEAAAQARPRLDLRVSYVQTSQPLQAFGAILNQGTFTETIDFNDPGQVDALTAGLHGRYAIYHGGQITARRAAAQAVTRAATGEAEATRRRLALDVVRTYFAIRTAGEAISAKEAALASLEEALRVGRLREQAGQLLVSERLNLEVQRAETAQEALASRYERAVWLRRFAVLLGLPAGDPVEVAPEDDSVARLALPAETAAAPRPELAALQAQVQAAERLARAARGGRRPAVDAFASSQVDRGWRRDGSGHSWTVGLAAEMPLFDGAAARSRISAADAEAAVARERLRQGELALALELEQARLVHELAREQAAVATQVVAQAEESARLSRERFAAGALLSSELIGVETRLAEARVRRATTLAQERSSLAALRVALGFAPLD